MKGPLSGDGWRSSGSAARLREIQSLERRGARGAEAAAHAAREAGGVPTRAAK